MRCAICGKEFGTEDNCQHCGSDRFTGLGNYSGYNAPVEKGIDGQSTNYIHQTENVGNVICYECNEIIPADSKFCPYCSKELYVTCPNCGHIYSSKYPACNQCGTNREKYIEQERIRKENAELEVERIRKEQGDSAAYERRSKEIELNQKLRARTPEGRAELEKERRYIEECRKKWRNQ